MDILYRTFVTYFGAKYVEATEWTEYPIVENLKIFSIIENWEPKIPPCR